MNEEYTDMFSELSGHSGIVRNTKAWPMCCFLLLGGHMKNGWTNSTQTE